MKHHYFKQIHLTFLCILVSVFSAHSTIQVHAKKTLAKKNTPSSKTIPPKPKAHIKPHKKLIPAVPAPKKIEPKTVATSTQHDVTPHFHDVIPTQPTIRVLLGEYELGEERKAIQIGCEQGLSLKGNLKSKGRLITKKKFITINIDKENILIPNVNGGTVKMLKNKVIVLPADGVFSFNGQSYDGMCTLYLNKEDRKVLVVNTLHLEDYVYAVLPSEMLQFWEHEIQMVQAIATRTYALHHIQNNKEAKRSNNEKPYDINCSKIHQVYRGLHHHTHLRKAVTDTAGMILTYQDKPIIAMFDVCCAGAIPARMACHNFDHAPYLARKQKCTYCEESKLYTWEKEIALEEFTNHLKSSTHVACKLCDLEPLTRVEVVKTDRAGLVQKIAVKSKYGMTELSGAHFHDCMRRLFRSMTFTVKRKRDSLIFKGNGFGHQTGLCQCGARALVKRGWEYSKILAFYYPKTSLSHVGNVQSLKRIFS